MLWKKRKDFEVITTFADADISKYKWNGGNFGSPNREDYLRQIKERTYVGVGYFKNYSAWSLSTIDGLSRGVPYVLPDKLCYSEMVGDDYPLMYKHKNADDFLRAEILEADAITGPKYNYTLGKSLDDLMPGLSFEAGVMDDAVFGPGMTSPDDYKFLNFKKTF